MQRGPAWLRSAAGVLRGIGQAIDGFGVSIQGGQAYVEHLLPSTRIVSLGNKALQPSGPGHFIAPTASVVGDVKLGPNSSVWYGATIRGDRKGVTVGRNVAVLDNATVAGGASLGTDVTIGPGAFVGGATLGDGVMIGMGARISDGATIGNDSFIDAGAVVPPGASVPAGTLFTGVPARQLRKLGSDEMAYLRTTAVVYRDAASRHAEQYAKTVHQVEDEAEWQLYRVEKGLLDHETLPGQTPDVLEYYKLTDPGADYGLLRTTEADVAAEAQRRTEEEFASDRAEEAYFTQLARMKRVGETIRVVAATRTDRPALLQKAVDDLEARDPEGAAMLKDIVRRVAASAGGGDPAAKSDVLRHLMALDPSMSYASDQERKNAAAGIFDALVKRAPALASSGGVSQVSAGQTAAHQPGAAQHA